MGMDVYGRKPTSETGKYFRNSVWWWRPLATYACAVAPDIAAHCKCWQSNDGDGLNAKQSAQLADRLQAEIDAGRTLLYAKRYTGAQEASPDEPCWLCEGTGTQRPVPERGAGDLKTGIKCNSCDGRGYVRPDSTHYPFSVENVQRFVAFLRDCGGFNID